MTFYQSHVFVCTNRRADGHSQGCCASKGGEKIRDYLKARAKELKIPQTRINAAGCLDRCHLGVVIAIYPQETWYQCNTIEDAEKILQEHLVGGTPVTALQLCDDQ
jgi:(2Fe-2S) ferredoxin